MPYSLRFGVAVTVLVAAFLFVLSGTVRAETGIASFYGGHHHGRKTASGERFNMHAMTAAHRTLPFGTRVSVCRVGSLWRGRDSNPRSAAYRVSDLTLRLVGQALSVSGSAIDQTLPRARVNREDHSTLCISVRINDRGPFVRGRIIDLSMGAAAALGITRKMGLARVTVRRH